LYSHFFHSFHFDALIGIRQNYTGSQLDPVPQHKLLVYIVKSTYTNRQEEEIHHCFPLPVDAPKEIPKEHAPNNSVCVPYF
jgi:hypothetical protein